MTSSALWFLVSIMVVLSHLAERDFFVLVSRTDSRVWDVLSMSSFIQRMPRDLWGSFMALLNSDPGNLNDFLPALFSHRDPLKIVVVNLAESLQYHCVIRLPL